MASRVAGERVRPDLRAAMCKLMAMDVAHDLRLTAEIGFACALLRIRYNVRSLPSVPEEPAQFAA